MQRQDITFTDLSFVTVNVFKRAPSPVPQNQESVYASKPQSKLQRDNTQDTARDVARPQSKLQRNHIPNCNEASVQTTMKSQSQPQLQRDQSKAAENLQPKSK